MNTTLTSNKFIVARGRIEFKDSNYRPANDKEALDNSIEKWKFAKKALDFLTGTPGSTSCACCTLYISDGCYGCPIAIQTASTSCDSTPYDKACRMMLAYFRSKEDNESEDRQVELRAAAVRAIQAEIDFLIDTRMGLEVKKEEKEIVEEAFKIDTDLTVRPEVFYLEVVNRSKVPNMTINPYEDETSIEEAKASAKKLMSKDPDINFVRIIARIPIMEVTRR